MTSRLGLKRRHFQFSIRTALLIMVPCALLFGWLGVRMQRARDRQARMEKQTEVVEKIAHLAAQATVFSETGDVVEVSLRCPVDDAEKIGEELAVLKELPALRVLVLARRQVADAALVHLQGFPALRELCLDDATVSDVGLMDPLDKK